MSSHRSETSPLLSEEWRRGSYLADVSPIIHERDDSITIRRPVQYYSINNSSHVSPQQHQTRTQATVNRVKYYSKLAPHRESILLMPNHVVPPEFFTVIPIKLEDGKQSSLVTIFSIWNTMMGTSLLSMPWAVQKAGFMCGIGIIVIMAGLTLYTAYRVMQSVNKFESDDLEFSDVCRYYLGRWGMYTSVVFSLVALLGAAIVYWVLMSNFLYNTVFFIYEKANNEFIMPKNGTYSDANCPLNKSSYSHHDTIDQYRNMSNSSYPSDHLFHTFWNQRKTVPFFLIAVLLPLINFKSPTFFTKFNALGTVCVAYILAFVAYKASHWGFHLDFTTVPEFNWTFPALTGTLSLALFIHNCVISIVRNQKNPENNGRDLIIAYMCVAGTYLFIGVIFYVSFPLQKNCIEDNLLNNFQSSDNMAFIARICLFFQMVTVFPLLMYIFRVQVMYAVYGTVYPGLVRVFVMNILIIAVCIIFAVFMPQIGTIIRFSGSLCGLAYIFALPCCVYMLARHEEGSLNKGVLISHVGLIIIGVANFIAQFLIIKDA